MTSLNDSTMRNMPGTVPPPAALLLLLSGQPTSFLKLLRRLGQMGVGVDMLTCVFTTQVAVWDSRCVVVSCCWAARVSVPWAGLRSGLAAVGQGWLAPLT